MKLPGASELFRPTGTDVAPGDVGPDSEPVDHESAVEPGQSLGQAPSTARAAGGTGRVRHEEKITVYVSSEELLALEQARLRLRAELGLAVDRGRLVRAAIALALSDLDAAGPSGELVRRLTAC